MLLASCLIALPAKSAVFSPEHLKGIPFAFVAVLLAYITVTIVLVQLGTPRFGFWQSLPTAIAMGSAVAITFLAWVHVEDEKADILFSLIAFGFFAPFLSLFFVLVLVVLPRFVGWK